MTPEERRLAERDRGRQRRAKAGKRLAREPFGPWPLGDVPPTSRFPGKLAPGVSWERFQADAAEGIRMHFGAEEALKYLRGKSTLFQ